ncbi:GD15913 [Drosophila simulans]|uniref:GD15913 n=1 Tax=Drosophila simulans TaxID=7240 RepID=B4R403_DROSI|nr:GD15913 [Drosophila simulans]
MKTFLKTQTMKRKIEVIHHDCVSDIDGSVSDGSEELEEQSSERIEEIAWPQMKREIGAMNRTLDEIQAQLANDFHQRDGRKTDWEEEHEAAAAKDWNRRTRAG